MRFAPVLFGLTTLFAQESGTIHGVVRDALSGAVMPGVTVTADGVVGQTGLTGGFSLRNVKPGEVRLDVSGDTVSSLGPRTVTIAPGQDVEVEVPVQGLGRISGVVVDGEGKPVPDVTVMLVTREYFLGVVRYNSWFATATNSRGEFGAASPMAITGGLTITIRVPQIRAPSFSLESGREYLLLASKGHALPADSTLAADPPDRPRIPYPAWYIGARTVEAAVPIILAPGERREGLTIRIEAGTNYCIEGAVRASRQPGGVLQMRVSDSPLSTQGPLGYINFSKKLTEESDTTVRFCNLAAGGYSIEASLLDGLNTFPRFFSAQTVTVTDHDAKIRVDGASPVSMSGEVVWEGEPLEGAIELALRPINHAGLNGETFTAKAAAGKFVFDRLLADTYELQFKSIPPGAYLKDVTSHGRSLLHRALAAGSLDDLRVVLARDSGRITAQALPGTWVVAVPAGAANEADVADAMLWGQADASGAWTSPALAPGKYLVMTSVVPVNRSVDIVGRLWRTRGKAQEAEVTPAATATVRTKDR
jgi:hypothetical protein